MREKSGKRVWQSILAGAACLGVLLAGMGNTGAAVRAEEAGSVSVSILHVHEGNEEEGGGCYRKVFHEHSKAEGCYRSGTCTVTVSGDGGFWSGDLDRYCSCHGNVHTVYQNVISRHSSCGAADGHSTISFKEYHGPGTADFDGYKSSTHNYDTLICSREGEVIGYERNCGEESGAEVAVLTVTPGSSGWSREVTLTASCEVKGNIHVDPAAYIWNDGSPTSQAVFVADRNGTYTCRLNAGGNSNATEAVAVVTVNRVDRTGPEITDVAYTREWTAGNVTVTVRAEDLQEDGGAGSGLAEDAYSFDNGISWQGNVHTCTENGTYKVLVRDILGNIGEKEIVIDCIDRTAPKLTVTPDRRANVQTNRVTLAAEDLQPDGSAGSGLAQEPWSFDGGKSWGRNPVAEIRENTVLTAAVRDALGNVAKTEVTIGNIDTTPPEFTLFLTPEDWAPEALLRVDALDKNDAGMQGAGGMEYSYDGGRSWSGRNSHVITENGLQKVAVRDALGNRAEKEISVERVDHTAPEASVTYNRHTASEVRIVVAARDLQPDGSEGSGLAEKPYSYDEGKTWTADHVFWAEENGEYPIWVKDRAGNILKKTISLVNMDHTGPRIDIIQEPAENVWTQGKVKVRVAASDLRDDGTGGVGLAENPWSYDEGKTWTQESELTFSGNGTWPVLARDLYGNESREEIRIRNIDVTAPRIFGISRDMEKNLPSVRVSVEAEDLQPDGSAGSGLADAAWSFDGGVTWTEENGREHDKNGTFQVMVRDRVGNVTERQYVIPNIDEYPPRVEDMLITREPEGWTRGNVVLTFTAEDINPDGSDGSGLAEKPWSYDGGRTWQEKNQCVAKENGVYRVRVRDKCGNVAVREITVDNIDRTGPDVTLRQKPLVWLYGEAAVTIEARDIQPDGSEGSGLDGQPFSENGENWSDRAEFTVDSPGTHICYVRDLLGNVTEASIQVKRAALPGGETTEGNKTDPEKPGSGGGGNSGGGNSGDSGKEPDKPQKGDGSSGQNKETDLLPVFPVISGNGTHPVPGGGQDAREAEKRGRSRKTGKDSGEESQRNPEEDTDIKEGEDMEKLWKEMQEGQTEAADDGPEEIREEERELEHLKKDAELDVHTAKKRNRLHTILAVITILGVLLLALLLIPFFAGCAILFGTDEEGREYPVALKRIHRDDGRNWMDMTDQACESDGTGSYLLWCGLWGKLHEGQILEIRSDRMVLSEAIIAVRTGIRL